MHKPDEEPRYYAAKYRDGHGLPFWRVMDRVTGTIAPEFMGGMYRVVTGLHSRRDAERIAREFCHV